MSEFTDRGGISPELAMQLGDSPFVGSKAETLQDQRKVVRLTRLAREYILDFDLVRACARADLDWDLVKHAEREPFFVELVEEFLLTIDEDLVVTRREILLRLKKEAYHAPKANERINALNSLARLTGMELGTDKKGDGAPPTINITLTTSKQ